MLTAIILIYSFINTGDVSHAEALYKHLAKENEQVIRINIDANKDQKAIVEEFKAKAAELKTSRVLIASIGEKGLITLEPLNKAGVIEPNMFVATSVHQFFNQIKELSPLIDFIAIPETAVDSGEKKQVVKSIPSHIFTLAVPTNNPNLEDLKKSYKEWNPQPKIGKPPITHPYIAILLPGDAPDLDGNIRYFTKASAKRLFNDVYELWKKLGGKHTLVVHNSPRTGKHDPITGKVICAHEYEKGKDPAPAEDEVSKSFVNLLKENHLPYYYYNFAFELEGGNKKSLSIFYPMLYLTIASADSYFIIPGESVSTMGQLPLYLDPLHTIIFKASSMNQQHLAILEKLYNQGAVSYFANRTIITPKKPVKMIKDDGELVATSLQAAFINWYKDK